jgi:hypothetical protein
MTKCRSLHFYIVLVVTLLCFNRIGVCQYNRVSTAAVVSGIVLNADDSQPIEGAIVIVTVEPAGPDSGEATGVKTGLDGRFNIPSLPAAQYRIRCQKPGFLAINRAVPGVSTGSGNQTSVVSIELRMVAHAVIEGKVTDAVGQPLTGAAVRLSRVQLEGRRTSLSMVTQGSTNDLGQYRIFGLEPGRYYVSASYEDAGATLGMRQRPATDGSTGVVTEDYAVVYYPGTPDPDTATAVRLRGGRVTSNIDLSVGMAQSFPVSGAITGFPVDAPPPRVVLRPADPASLGAIRITSARAGDSHFHFRSVPPGNYVVRVDLNVRDQVLSAREEIAVSSTVGGVNLDLQAPFSVAGVVSGEEGVRIPTSLKLKLRGADKHVQADLKMDDYGRFQVPNVGADGYSIVATDDTGKIFVRSIFLDDRPAPSGWVTVLGPGHNLRVVVSDKAGRIDGAAVDSSQRPTGSGLAVLVGADTRDSQSYAASVDSNGNFKFQSLPPGKYRVLCFSDLAGSQEVTWDVQKKVKADGKEINIVESDTQQVTLEILQFDPI